MVVMATDAHNTDESTPEPFADDEAAVKYQSTDDRWRLDMALLDAILDASMNSYERASVHSVPRMGNVGYHVSISGKYISGRVYDTLDEYGFRVIASRIDMPDEITDDQPAEWAGTHVLRVQRTRPATAAEDREADPDHYLLANDDDLRGRVEEASA